MKERDKKWNTFVNLLIRAEERFLAIQKELQYTPGSLAPEEKILSSASIRKGTFSIALEHLVLFARTHGGWESLKIIERKEEELEEDEYKKLAKAV